MKTFQLIALCFSSYVCNAQLVEHFNDGNFTTDPVWLGSQAHFIINASQQLQLNNTVGGTSYLSTPFGSASLDGFEWEVYVKQSFASSGSNFGRIYLVADHENLTGPLNGYYLQLGEAGSNDAVELFRQSGSVHTSVCRTVNGGIAASFSIRVKVTRSPNGIWTLFIDTSGGTDFAEAAHGTDATFTSSLYFGVYCIYTAGNANKFFFDDLIAGPPLGDVTPPILTGIQVPNDSTLHLSFDEPLDSIQSQSLPRYSVSDSVGHPFEVKGNSEWSQLTLAFQDHFVNGKQYQISIDSMADAWGNWSEPASISFRFFVPAPAASGNIVFNELYADPSPTLGLPAQEFLELFNSSARAFNLEGWSISDLTTTSELPSIFLLPGEYLIVTSTAGLPNYNPYGMTLGLAEMPTLNNSSDTFVLRDSAGAIIDSVHYTLALYGDDDHALGGYTLERLQPSAASNLALNWTASLDSIGGTPGKANSVMGHKLDTNPPHVDSLKVVDKHQLMIYFNEPVDLLSLGLPGSYLVESSRQIPAEVAVTERAVGLSFTSGFINGAEDHLLIDHVLDTVNNSVDSLRIPFRFFVPGVPVKGSVVINEIMADPAPVEYLPEAEFIEIVNLDTLPFDLQGWTLSDATSTATLPATAILPGELIILTASSNIPKFLEMGRVLGFSGFPSLNNSGEPLTLRSAQGLMIDSLRYDVHWFEDDPKRDGGWTLERLLQSYSSTSPLNWRPSRDTLGGTPGRINSIVGDKLDAKPPIVDSLVVLSDGALRLVFSESMDSSSLTVLSRYSVSEEHPDAAAINDASVTLTFASQFGNGHSNMLVVDSLSDASGNLVARTNLPFRYFVPGIPRRGDVVINEIMADPAPVVHLPEAEYVEIFNNAEEPFDLNRWTISDATSTALLPPSIILPHEFIILTNTSNATKYSEGHVVGVVGFPSLNNSGEPLVLRATDSTVIDSVRFRVDWFEDDQKGDGGWALERLLQDYSSTSPLNWRPSRDSLGGTPGKTNSIVGDKLDSKAPEVDSLVVLSNFSLRVHFSEPMDSASLAPTASYSVSGVHPSMAVVQETLATLIFSFPFYNGYTYTLLIDSVSDSSGNQLVRETLPFRYFVPGDPLAGDVVINEIMADPTPVVHLPEAEYLEIFNNAEEPFDLNRWTISDATSTALLPPSIILPHEFIILTNTSNATKYSEGHVVGVVGFPSLNNSGEPLVLRAADSTVIDSVYFRIDWFEDDPRQDGGWSLERLLYDYPTSSALNWRPALDSSGGTPGQPNSILGQKLDAKPPVIDSLVVHTDKILQLFFNEPMDSLSAIHLSSYYISATNETPFSAALLDNSVELKFSTAFINGRDNILMVDSVKDMADNLLSAALPFRYFTPGRAASGDVVFNEIMSDPAPVVHLPETEYIEIFNRSTEPFELKGWTLADATSSATLPEAVMLPGEFIILTTSAGAQKFAAGFKTIAVPGFPSLNNTGEPVVLRSADSTLIDSLRYDLDWFDDVVKKDGGWSLERLLYDSSSSSVLNWRVAVDSSGGTPGVINSIVGQKFDAVPPRIDSVLAMNARTLRLYFSEPMDKPSVDAGIYTIEGSNETPLAVFAADTVTTLTFEHPFPNGVERFLRIENVTDLAGNVIDRQRFSFMYFVPGAATPGVIRINEIMSDPSPVVGLPEAEYVEIVNQGTEPYDLLGWTISDSTHEAYIPSRIILPGELLILTSTSNATRFDTAIVIGVPGFPSLNNAGETLMIQAPDLQVIDSIRYDLNWFDNTYKEDGGWSLERLLAGHSSTDPVNWRPSVDSSGGTPGRVNSIAGQPIDNIPPAIDSLVIINNHKLCIYLSEPVDSIALKPIGKFLIEENNDRPVDLESEGSRVTIEFSNAFVNGDQYHLIISGVTDGAGNVLDSARLAFTWFVPGVTGPHVVVISEIMADPSPAVQLPDAEYVEIVNRTDSPFDLHGWRFSDATTSAVLPSRIIRPGEYVILTSTTNASKFGNDRVLGVTAFPSLSNAGESLTIRTSEGVTIDSLSYSTKWCSGDEKCEGGWSIERIRLDFESHSTLNWRVSQDSTGGTPGRQNSVAGQKLDVIAPTVDSVVVINQRSLGVYFSEPMKATTLQLFENYTIEEIEMHPMEIASSQSSVTIIFEQAFTNGREYLLSIMSVTDTADNPCVPIRSRFRYLLPGAVKQGAILINEIMADPTPVVQLAEAEFVEIVNPGLAPVDLQGWTLSDATTTAVLPPAIILPGQFLILTSNTNKSKFDGPALGITGFPSLNNLGEPIVLRSQAGVTIDSVQYNVQWYGSDSKADGGWTLERLRYEFDTNWILNWKPSTDPRGGTPGTANSRFGEHPDQVAPRVITAKVVDPHAIEILFDEPVVIPSSTGILWIGSMECVDFVTNGSTARFIFDSAFVNGNDYNLRIEGIRDSIGNEMAATEMIVTYFEPSVVSSRDVVITEIMVDPTPVVGLPEAEYIEVYNRSARPINLAGWSLTDANNTVYLPRMIIMPGEYKAITSSSSAEKFTSPAVVGISSFPSLSNDGEGLVIRDPNGLMIDSLLYNVDWYHNIDKSDGGWSLELIDTENPCAGEDNWTASEAFAGGSPGSVNSVNANKPDFSGPKLLLAEAGARTVLLHFDERLEKTLTRSTVDLVPSAGNYSMRFADPPLKTIIVQFDEELKVSMEYQVTVENIFDCNGNVIDLQFNKAKFAIPESPLQGDIVVNEILFDPRPNGVDFVEVYNQGSRYVDLGEWTLGGRTPDDKGIIRSGTLLSPQSYMVFTSDAVTLKSQYPHAMTETFVEADMPSLPDDEGLVVLRDRENISVDSVPYSTNMHSQMLRDAEGVSLERVSPASLSVDPSNWASGNESAGFATPGFANSGARSIPADGKSVVIVSPEVLSFHATETFVLVQYNLEEPGYYVNCRILDQQGREVKELAQNASVGSQGFFRWDGDDASGRRALPGYYLVYFEYFSLEGQVRVSRNRVVVAPR